MRHLSRTPLLVLWALLLFVPRGGFSETEKLPRIYFPQKVISFGTVVQGETVVRVFTFENRGEAPLRIVKLHSSCLCAPVLLSQKVIPPGGKGKIQVSFHTEGLDPQHYDLYVDVYHNDPRERDNGPFVSRLALTGRVTMFFEVQPLGANYLGVFSHRRPPERQFIISARDGQAFRVLRVAYPSSKVEVRLEPKGAAVRHTLKVKVKPDRPVGDFSALLQLYTDHPRQKKMVLKLWGRVLGDVVCVPDYILFGPVRRHHDLDRRRRRISIVLREGRGLQVTKVRIDPKRFQLQLDELVPGKRWEVTLTVRPDAPKGPFAVFLEVWTNHKKFPYLRLPVLGSVEADVVCVPSALILSAQGRGEMRILGPEKLELTLKKLPTPLKGKLERRHPGEWALLLQWPKEAQPSSWQIVLKTNIAGEETLVIPIVPERSIPPKKQ